MHTQQKRCSFLGAIGIALACSFVLTAAAMGEDKVKIALIDAAGAAVKESVTGTLELDRKYAKGDRIVVTGAKHLVVKVDRHFAETILFAPKGKVDYPIPLWPVGKYPKKYPHASSNSEWGEAAVFSAKTAI